MKLFFTSIFMGFLFLLLSCKHPDQVPIHGSPGDIKENEANPAVLPAKLTITAPVGIKAASATNWELSSLPCGNSFIVGSHQITVLTTSASEPTTTNSQNLPTHTLTIYGDMMAGESLLRCVGNISIQNQEGVRLRTFLDATHEIPPHDTQLTFPALTFLSP